MFIFLFLCLFCVSVTVNIFLAFFPSSTAFKRPFLRKDVLNSHTTLSRRVSIEIVLSFSFVVLFYNTYVHQNKGWDYKQCDKFSHHWSVSRGTSHIDNLVQYRYSAPLYEHEIRIANVRSRHKSKYIQGVEKIRLQ